MTIVRFPLRYRIKSEVRIVLLLAWCIFLSNTINAQNMNDFVENRSFLITEKPQKVYKSYYKDGQPYQGYFSKGNIEFPRVDYYENGVIKFQYSLDVYQMALGADTFDESQEVEEYQMNEEEYDEYLKNKYKPRLNIKSVYENGKIIDGYEYEEVSSTIFSKKIENKKITELHIDVFAMHYYQRTSMILKGDTIIIGSPTLAVEGNKFQVNLLKKDNYWEIQYHMNDEYIGSKYFVIGETNHLPKRSIFFMYDKNNSTYGYGTSGFQDNLNSFDLINITNVFFDKPEVFELDEMDVFFRDLIDAIIAETKRGDETYPKEPEKYRGYLETGDHGDIVAGIRFFEKEIDSYYEEYKEGDKVKKEKIDLINFQKVFKNYLSKVRDK
ncbi:hypothetical protein [Aquimarina sp. AU119]|uniref:hypothetical protein n=1 Tax=Aquimarina sp. AU119 TaxID=2108528 RepID=UPI00135A6EF3|nr:hypothetical protein [Aquimarina sp. AU119]